MTGAWAVVLAVGGILLGTTLADLIGEEVRGRLDRLPFLLIRHASARLAPDIRDSTEQEWVAELEAILERHCAEMLPVTRLVVGLRYAGGLARSVSAINKALSNSPSPESRLVVWLRTALTGGSPGIRELLVRSTALTLMSVIGLILYSVAAGVGRAGAPYELDILVTALLLLATAAVVCQPALAARTHLPPRWFSHLSLLECMTTATIIAGGPGSTGLLFLPYLAVSLFLAGRRAGLRTGLMAAVLATGVLIAGLTSSASNDEMAWQRNGTLLAWLLVFFAAPLIGAWLRRIRKAEPSLDEPEVSLRVGS